MSRRGTHVLNVADLVENLTRNMSIIEKSRFERELVKNIPAAIKEAADLARTQTKPKPKGKNGE